MRSFAVVFALVCLSSLCEAGFSDSYVVNMTGYNPSYLFYSSDSLFVLFQTYNWGSQPILSKVDPSSGQIVYNLTIPFTRCYPCAPQVNSLQVNENFVILSVENGTLWELYTVDIVAAQPSILATYTPDTPGFVRNLLPDGQDSILITETFSPVSTTSRVVYNSAGTSIVLSPISTPSIPGIEGISYGAVNLTPDMALICGDLTSSIPPYENFISFESNSGKVEDAVNGGWGYNCPIISISTQLQGICTYYTLSSPPIQRLWCWNYSLYPSLIPPQVTSYDMPGAAFEGVGDDAGNFIGCYTDTTGSYLVQYSVNYDQSTYEIVATAAVKQNYRCASYQFQKPVMNNRISTSLQQVANVVSSYDANGFSVYSVLAINYDSSASSL